MQKGSRHSVILTVRKDGKRKKGRGMDEDTNRNPQMGSCSYEVSMLTDTYVYEESPQKSKSLSLSNSYSCLLSFFCLCILLFN